MFYSACVARERINRNESPITTVFKYFWEGRFVKSAAVFLKRFYRTNNRFFAIEVKWCVFLEYSQLLSSICVRLVNITTDEPSLTLGKTVFTPSYPLDVMLDGHLLLQIPSLKGNKELREAIENATMSASAKGQKFEATYAALSILDQERLLKNQRRRSITGNNAIVKVTIKALHGDMIPQAKALDRDSAPGEMLFSIMRLDVFNTVFDSLEGMASWLIG
jgi:hypothetical protein